MILNSGLVEYVEDWCKSSANQELQGAAMSHYKEKQLELGLNPEFEDELHLQTYLVLRNQSKKKIKN